jgi:hypothetical protein
MNVLSWIPESPLKQVQGRPRMTIIVVFFYGFRITVFAEATVDRALK